MSPPRRLLSFFFFNDTPTTEIYTLPLHDALPICVRSRSRRTRPRGRSSSDANLLRRDASRAAAKRLLPVAARRTDLDRKSTRLNSSHGYISYAVFCLKKKKKKKMKRIHVNELKNT